MQAIRYLFILIFLAALSGVTARAADTPAGGAVSAGTVVSTEDAGNYTYVQIDVEGKRVWFAAPALELKPGDKVTAPPGLPMKDFYSKALDRTFDLVYFVGKINRANGAPDKAATLPPGTAAALPPGHPPMHAAKPKAPESFDFSGIKRPAGGKTVAEIHRDKEKLSGKSVVVRGIAVKVSNSIMGKNWVHLQDGSGAAPANDLTVTTMNKVNVGDTLTATGVLATDRDFGYGYKYAVLLEDAAVQSE